MEETNFSSVYIAEYLNKRHTDISSAIRKYIEDINNDLFSKENVVLSTYKDAKGVKRKSYLLNQDQFIFLMMSATGDTANKFKESLIKSFSEEEMQDLFNHFSKTLGYPFYIQE